MNGSNTNTSQNSGVDPNYFYWVPTPSPYYPPFIPMPVYPAPAPAPCPGCGRCPVCGRKDARPAEPTITWSSK